MYFLQEVYILFLLGNDLMQRFGFCINTLHIPGELEIDSNIA